jgi:hypothetical protein
MNTHEFLINNWLFNFKEMYATDYRKWSKANGHRRLLQWDGEQILMCNNLSTKFYKIFVEPEDHHNNTIAEAYKNWVLDQEIERQLGDNNV